MRSISPRGVREDSLDRVVPVLIGLELATLTDFLWVRLVRCTFPCSWCSGRNNFAGESSCTSSYFSHLRANIPLVSNDGRSCTSWCRGGPACLAFCLFHPYHHFRFLRFAKWKSRLHPSAWTLEIGPPSVLRHFSVRVNHRTEREKGIDRPPTTLAGGSRGASSRGTQEQRTGACCGTKEVGKIHQRRSPSI